MMNSVDMLPIAILAGGLATRLRPVTEKIPKSLIEINGEPFIFHQLRLLQKNGFKNIVICAGFLGEMIVDYVGNGEKFNLHVEYSFDGEKLLGTGGALKQALPKLGEEFFVVYGDSYLPCDYAAVQNTFQSADKLALMTVFKNAGQWDTSNVEYSDGKILVYDKKNKTERMHYIDYGLGIFNQAVFKNVSTTEPTDLADIYMQLLKENQLAAYEVNQRFYEAGSFSGIKELEAIL